MDNMTIYESMNHSMGFSENERHILNEIAKSADPISAYGLSKDLEKDYSTIHKACKKLIVCGILETVESSNDKTVQKNILVFTLYGFCKFVAQSELFFWRGPLLIWEGGFELRMKKDSKKTVLEYESFDIQTKILERWKCLHESIGWVHSLTLKIPKKNEGFKLYLLRMLNMACARLTSEVFTTDIPATLVLLKPPAHMTRGHYTEKNESIELTLSRLVKHIDNNLYDEIFKGFEFFICSNDDNMSTEAINIIKNSEKGQPKIKEYISLKMERYERLKEIDKLL